MGLLVLGLGVGGVGAYGSVLHALNNGLVKCMLFLVVGNMILAVGSSVASDLRGMLAVRPISAALMLVGLFAVTGSPPFGLFVSEFSIVSGAIREHHPWVAGAALVLLAVIFIGIGAMMLGIVFGAPESGEQAPRVKERGWLVAGPLGLATLVLMLGLYIPAPLRTLLEQAATSLGGSAP
jgi:hydrogenase-4 component F